MIVSVLKELRAFLNISVLSLTGATLHLFIIVITATAVICSLFMTVGTIPSLTRAPSTPTIDDRCPTDLLLTAVACCVRILAVEPLIFLSLPTHFTVRDIWHHILDTLRGVADTTRTAGLD
jgi:hypothetical protein